MSLHLEIIQILKVMPYLKFIFSHLRAKNDASNLSFLRLHLKVSNLRIFILVLEIWPTQSK